MLPEPWSKLADNDEMMRLDDGVGMDKGKASSVALNKGAWSFGKASL
jgi:hypothetical protein